MTTLTRNTAETPLSQWTVQESTNQALPASEPATPLMDYPPLAPPRPYRSCHTPAMARLDSVGSHAAILGWSSVSTANYYAVQGGTVGGTIATTTTMDTFLLVTPLDSGNTYTWRVGTWCLPSNPSLWSPWEFFTATAPDSASRESAPSVRVSELVAVHCLGAYPNPFQDVLAVKLHLTVPGRVTAQITDAGGRMVWSQDLGPQPDGLVLRRLQGLGTLPSGSYRLHLQLDGVNSGGWTLAKP